MHRTAEYGIAAHWRYKEGGGPRQDPRNEVDEALTWFRQVLEWQQDTAEPEEFMEFLRMDLFQGEIFVFTPKGDVKALPQGSTPIDFAFASTPRSGVHCAGAKVNGRIAPLSRELRNGDTIEIITNPRQRPNRDWLAFVKTSRARQRIRQWIRKEEFDSALKLGKEFLDRELKKAQAGRCPESPDVLGEGAARTSGTRLRPGVRGARARRRRTDRRPQAVLSRTTIRRRSRSASRRPSRSSPRSCRISSRGVRIQGDGQPDGALLPLLPAGARGRR